MTDYQLKMLILFGFLLTTVVLARFALRKKHKLESKAKTKINSAEVLEEAHGSNQKPCSPPNRIEGSILEYQSFFLKADSDGFIVTQEGDLSIEFFKDKEVIVETENEGLDANSMTQNSAYVKTNFGKIHNQHFILKGVG